MVRRLYRLGGWNGFFFSLAVSATAARAFSRVPPLFKYPPNQQQNRHLSSYRLLSSSHRALSLPRGGKQEDQQQQQHADKHSDTSTSSPREHSETVVVSKPKLSSIFPLDMIMSTFTAFGAFYASSLDKRPIVTKSITACAVFALSDFIAQRLEQGGKTKVASSSLNWSRLVSGALVGLLYFGPAAHYWYETIFRLLPGTTLGSILQKAVLGQLLFGPSFTCIFFAISLLQSGTFSIRTWVSKIRNDLPGAWLAGASFWPLVDLISYSFVPQNYIPLFINLCSLVWTIYLSGIANKNNQSSSSRST